MLTPQFPGHLRNRLGGPRHRGSIPSGIVFCCGLAWGPTGEAVSDASILGLANTAWSNSREEVGSPDPSLGVYFNADLNAEWRLAFERHFFALLEDVQDPRSERYEPGFADHVQNFIATNDLNQVTDCIARGLYEEAEVPWTREDCIVEYGVVYCSRHLDEYLRSHMEPRTMRLEGARAPSVVAFGDPSRSIPCVGLVCDRVCRTT